MASYTIAPAWSCHAKPANFSFEEAANFLGNYETAYHVVVHCAEAKGQLTSKGNFVVFKSIKKRQQIFMSISALVSKMGQIKKIKAFYYNG
jgi:hypothetical protein